MSKPYSQPGLFDIGPEPDPAAAAQARAQMQEMIDRLRAASVSPWATYMDVILQCGVFKRAMWRVQKDEGEALWAEFETQLDRLDVLSFEGDPKSEI